MKLKDLEPGTFFVFKFDLYVAGRIFTCEREVTRISDGVQSRRSIYIYVTPVDLKLPEV